MPPSNVHFNGSVNLPDAEAVMREISTRIPLGVRRMTDGETGERGYWILFQIQKFLAMPEFEAVSAPGQAYETADDAPAMPQLRLKADASADSIVWPDLGYAQEYAKSFAIFDRLQREGVIAPGVRFQVQYPTPMASTAVTFVFQDLPEIAVAYERALFDDLEMLLQMIPPHRLAVQWDVAVEFGMLEGAYGPPVPLDQIAPSLVRCVDRVPEDVPVGMHLCYGDYGHQHFKDPESLQMQVDVVNAVTAASARPLSFTSFTVPQTVDGAGYFAPLLDLTAGPETELNFALVPYHPAAQAAGTTAAQIRHIDALLGGRDWGICTECGMGRVATEDVPTLLDLHRTIIEGLPAQA